MIHILEHGLEQLSDNLACLRLCLELVKLPNVGEAILKLIAAHEVLSLLLARLAEDVLVFSRLLLRNVIWQLGAHSFI